MSISGRGNPVSGYTAVLIGSVAVGAIVFAGDALVSPVVSPVESPPPPQAERNNDATMAATSENL